LIKNTEFKDYIPSIRPLTAITIIAELGDINCFIKLNHLVASLVYTALLNSYINLKEFYSKGSKIYLRTNNKASI